MTEGTLEKVGEGLETAVGMGWETCVRTRRQHHGTEVIHKEEGIHGAEGLRPPLTLPGHEARQRHMVAIFGGLTANKRNDALAFHRFLLICARPRPTEILLKTSIPAR
jgi:hypothetical protein